jgi:rRNA maturation endonuclease Nob1
MNTYVIECDVCDATCHIVSKEEPEFCAMCGTAARPVLLDKEDDDV